MSIDTAEQLKREWTDKYVTVHEGVPELRRFVGFVGQVKTVNMNCRALVEFNSPEDISWYDIDPSFLTVTQAPVETTGAQKTAKNSAGKATAGSSPNAAKTPKSKSGANAASGLSALEMARQQGAGNSAADASKSTAKPTTVAQPAKSAKAATSNSGTLSPLELARQQGAAGSTPKTKPASPPAPSSDASDQSASDSVSDESTNAVAESPEASSAKPGVTKPAPPTKPASGLSALELARQQGAVGSQKSQASPAASTQATADADSVIQSAMSTDSAANNAADNATATATGKVTPKSSGLSPLELARQQGAVGSGSGDASSDSNDSDDGSTTTPADSVIDNALAATSDGGAEDPVAGKKKKGKTPQPDDLKIVEGIGPKIEQLLKDAGISNWVALAETPTDTIKEVLAAAGNRFKMHEPTTWPLQAGLAAQGKWDELQKLQDELQGGRS